MFAASNKNIRGTGESKCMVYSAQGSMPRLNPWFPTIIAAHVCECSFCDAIWFDSIQYQIFFHYEAISNMLSAVVSDHFIDVDKGI